MQTQMLAGFLPSLAIGAALLGATGVWIPRVVQSYGRKYFDWKAEQKMPLASVFALVATSLAWFALAVYVKPMPWNAQLGAAAMIAALAGVVVADHRFQLIPDRFQLLGLAGALVYAAQENLLGNIGVALALGGGLWLVNEIYRRVRKRDGLGFGDVKLFVWLEIVLGGNILVVLLLACLLCGVAVLPSIARKKRRSDASFAFGPYVVLGVALVVVMQSLAV